MSAARPGDPPRCYLASPHGFTDAGRHYHDAVLLPALSRVVRVVDPWALSTEAEFAAARDAGELARFLGEVGRRNAEAIRGCDLLVACLDGQEVDAGTAAEVGFAAALGIPCHGLRTDLRRAGEDGALVNLQLQYFISSSGGRIHARLDDLVAALRGAGAAGA